MALSTSPTLQQIRAEIARNSNRTTSSTEVQSLKGCLQAAIPGGFNRTYLALASNTDIDGAGRNQKDFRAYEQDSPYFDYGISWTSSASGVYDLTTYFNCDFNVDVAVNPTYNASYVTVNSYVWPFFNPNCSYQSHSITGRNEAVRVLRVTFDTFYISTNTSVSIVMESNYTYQSSQLNESLPVVTYTVGPQGPGGFNPGGFP